MRTVSSSHPVIRKSPSGLVAAVEMLAEWARASPSGIPPRHCQTSFPEHVTSVPSGRKRIQPTSSAWDSDAEGRVEPGVKSRTSRPAATPSVLPPGMKLNSAGGAFSSMRRGAASGVRRSQTKTCFPAEAASNVPSSLRSTALTHSAASGRENSRGAAFGPPDWASNRILRSLAVRRKSPCAVCCVALDATGGGEGSKVGCIWFGRIFQMRTALFLLATSTRRPSGLNFAVTISPLWRIG